jgi:hypothetical protein
MSRLPSLRLLRFAMLCAVSVPCRRITRFKMAQQSSRYMQGIDELIAETPIDRVASHYGLPLPTDGTTEYRLNCVFDESCREDTYGHLTVKLTDPAKLIFCHSCRVRGNLLT